MQRAHLSRTHALSFAFSAMLIACGDFAAPPSVGEQRASVPQALARQPVMRWLGRYTSEAGFDSLGAEIVAFHAPSAKLVVSSMGARRVEIVSIRDPGAPALVSTLSLADYGSFPTSVAVNAVGIVAVAVAANDLQSPGSVVLFDIAGNALGSVQVGAKPDMLTFTPNGRTILVANEGEPSSDYLVDPEGSVSIVPLRWGWPPVRQEDVRTVSFAGFNEAELDPSVRIHGIGSTVAQDLEPEYVAVSDDSQTAWVTLQENNALAVVDVRRAIVRRLVGLGFQDHSLPGFGLDASDKDDATHIANYPILGMRLPDGIEAFRVRGRQYLITANEGDAREYDALTEEVRCAKLTLDPGAYPDAETLLDKAALGRLNCSSIDGDVDGDGDIDQMYSYGTRSFSIYDGRGQLLFDSGDEFEQTIAALDPDHFNYNDDDNDSFDSRSDNKGPEPEAVVTGRIRGRTYAFIGLERVGGIMMYDVSSPEQPAFVQYLNSRDFSGEPALGTAGYLGPEGIAFIDAAASPTRKALLAVAFEMSGTTSIFEVD
jgi:DNA-binding beta-propeller fold protein YncE